MPCWDCQLSSVNYNLNALLLNHDYINPADSRQTVDGAHQWIFERQSTDFSFFLSSGVKNYYNKSIIFFLLANIFRVWFGVGRLSGAIA